MVVNKSKNEDILIAAQQAFLEKGYGAASMEYIAKKANVSKQTLYSHFTNKEELFSGVMELKCRNIVNPLVDAVEKGIGIEEFFYCLGVGLLKCVTDDESLNMYRLIVSESIRFPELSAKFMDNGPRKGCEMVAKYLDGKVASGELKCDDTLMAAQFFCDMVKASVHTGRLLGKQKNLSENEIDIRVREAIRVFMSAYGV